MRTDLISSLLETSASQGSQATTLQIVIRIVITNILNWLKQTFLYRCASKDYGALSELPKASIVITFHNSEHLLNIVHTLHSIFENSPHGLIHEVIIIDDKSVKGECQLLGALSLGRGSDLNSLLTYIRH